MINAPTIGKRIRLLRKQNHISQEKMAEDLGMYQADISNLERAISGSGITDLFKLDLIADYFRIPLTDLIAGDPSESVTTDSKPPKAEEPSLKDYRIDNIQSTSTCDAVICELKLISPDGRTLFRSFMEKRNELCFYKTNSSILNRLLTVCDDDTIKTKVNSSCFLSGQDYIDIFNKVNDEDLDVCRYLIFLATEDESSVQDLIRRTKHKTFAQIEVPVPSCEPEDLLQVNYSDLSVVYRYRLMVEANLKNPSVYSDIENLTKREKAILAKLKTACVSEEAYKVWKKDLIDAKVKEVMEKKNIVTCSYLFAGIGQYKEIMPEEMVPSFRCWIDHNGSAFFGESRPATKREIRTYVSQHIADELLGFDSPLE